MKQLVIGRSTACDVVIEGDHVSRIHCKLTLAEGVLLVEDLGSANGTYLDGRRLVAGRPARVHGRSDLRIGRTYRLSLGALLTEFYRQPARAEGRNLTVASSAAPAAELDEPEAADVVRATHDIGSGDEANGATEEMVHSLDQQLEPPTTWRRRPWVVLALYTLFYVPGLVMNIVWWSRARRLAAVGLPVQAQAALTWLLVWMIGAPLLGGLVCTGLHATDSIQSFPWAGVF